MGPIFAGPFKRKLPVVEFVIIIYRNYQVKEPLLPHPLPDRPCQVLAADMLVLAQGKFVVLVGYYSKYFELTQLKDSTSASVINCLKQHMSRHEIPEVLHSHNGPEFSSLKFQQSAKQYQYYFSMLLHHQDFLGAMACWNVLYKQPRSSSKKHMRITKITI